MSKIHQYAAMALGMAAMAEAGMQDVYDWKDMPNYFNPAGTTCKRIRKRDDKAFAKKVEKRRKKNKNKKTHRK